MRGILLFLMLLSALLLSAEEVTIKGVSSLPGKPIRVIVQSDLVSGLEKTIAQTTTDFKGSFELKFKLDDIAYASIAAGLHRTEMLLSPGNSYTIQLSVKHFEPVSYYDAEPLTLNVLQHSGENLIRQVEDVNIVYNAFVMQHFNALYRLNRAALLDTLRQVIATTVPVPANDFVKAYIQYKLASLEPLVKKMTKQQIFESHFKSKQVLYNNPEYMGLFKEVFGSYLLNNKKFPFTELLQTVFEGMISLNTFISKDLMFKGEDRLRELLILVNLNGLYHHPSFSSGSVKNVLDAYQKSSVFPEHRLIADNILTNQQKLAFGTDAPKFELTDNEGKRHSVSDFKGLTLLSFVQKDCRVCDKELLAIKELHSSQQANFQFYTIATKDAFPYYKSFFANNKIEWPLLNLGDDILLLEAYNIKVYPDFMLLLPDGKIGMAPAPPVDQNLEYHMNRLKRQVVNQ
ncbi:MAG: redoxin domain-containing protein [Bacteroidetes bacterium]|jgi:peroxiredoxin|nr:redoxin domain-containing protein [Bacteroidota bacterium]